MQPTFIPKGKCARASPVTWEAPVISRTLSCCRQGRIVVMTASCTLSIQVNIRCVSEVRFAIFWNVSGLMSESTLSFNLFNVFLHVVVVVIYNMMKVSVSYEMCKYVWALCAQMCISLWCACILCCVLSGSMYAMRCGDMGVVCVICSVHNGGWRVKCVSRYVQHIRIGFVIAERCYSYIGHVNAFQFQRFHL